MSIPEKLRPIQTRLKGSRWRRRVGRHTGAMYTLVRYNGVGVKLERDLKGWQRQHGSRETDRFCSENWDGLLRLYEIIKEGNEVEVHVDPSGIVESVNGLANYQESKPPAPIFRECKSQYHKGNRVIDIGKFSYSKRNLGQLKVECDDCSAARKKTDAAYQETQKTSSINVSEIKQPGTPYFDNGLKTIVATEPRTTFQEEISSTYGKTRWQVTVIREVNETVWAKDYLDAASAFDGQGEIVRIEKL